MRMRAFLALVVVAAVIGVAAAGAAVPGPRGALVVGLPYAAFAVFVVGLVWRVARWAAAPVPFRIPTTCGQQRSLPWLRRQPLESPAGTLGVLGRMALEVLAFRSLFRNTRARLGAGGRLSHLDDKWLWLGGLVFHYSLALVLVRHLRLCLDPIPAPVALVVRLDGSFQIGLPEVYLSTVGISLGLGYLTLRRFTNPQVRALSLAADYLPLFLLLAIAATGILLRHFVHGDVVAAKEAAVGLVTFHPRAPAGLSALFVVHLTLVCVLVAYIPLSKLTHMAGVFLSPTRNLANDNRARRHVNPWNRPVAVHPYEEWEHEFQDKLVAAGLPLDRPEGERAAAAPDARAASRG